ncbi:HNH endonuclease signature motif containing protein [Gordonia cholesterolivorans]|uniref:HNH endonuclease signature motif containing protein n=1 Tax=Gordonia cholesterolivorans TaxID=559625 RepID=A0ABN3H8K0_9ACTN
MTNPSIDAAGVGGVDTSDPAAQDLADITAVAEIARQESHLAWLRLGHLYAMQRRRAAGSAGDVESARLLADATAIVGAEAAIVQAVSKDTGIRQVTLAVEASERLPQTARLLRDGVISARAFGAIVLQCGAVTDAALMAAIDAEIAQDLRGHGAVSMSVAEQTARRFVAEYDADGVRDKRRANTPGVTIAHDVDQSALTVATRAEDVTLMDKATRARAARVCEADSRTVGQRRADVVVAAVLGTRFGCDCGRDDCPARAAEEEVRAQFAKIVVHVVVDASTLSGGGDKAAYLDGFGVIDAHHAREIAARADATVRPLDIAGLAEQTAQAGNPYRPTAACDAAVRAVHGTCSVPGCNRSAWACDLDHVCEYNHAQPAAGGQTCPCNLNPKCRFHHLIKTYADGWLDDQVVDANGVIWTETTTPSGYTVRARARNHWLLPDLGSVPCLHGAPVAPGFVDTTTQPGRSRTRTQAKHAYRMRLRSQRRRAETAVLDSPGEPPF